MRKILTIDVGGTFTKFAVMSGTRTFKIAEQNKIPTPKKYHEKFLSELVKIYEAHSDAEGIAMSMPGLIDTREGICIASDALEFSSGHCIAEELKAMCSVPVTVENDANCAALAEIKSGALTDVKDAFVLVFGTAVGGAFIRNREIYRGAHNCAGEVSFTLKNSISVMTEKNLYGTDISVTALRKSCAKILSLPPEEVTGEMIFELIDENDDDILDALYKFAHGVAGFFERRKRCGLTAVSGVGAGRRDVKRFGVQAACAKKHRDAKGGKEEVFHGRDLFKVWRVECGGWSWELKTKTGGLISRT